MQTTLPTENITISFSQRALSQRKTLSFLKKKTGLLKTNAGELSSKFLGSRLKRARNSFMCFPVCKASEDSELVSSDERKQSANSLNETPEISDSTSENEILNLVDLSSAGGANQESDEYFTNLPAWQKRWNVTWGSKEIALGLFGWILSFIGSGLIVQTLAIKTGWTPWREVGTDEPAIFLLTTQIIRTLVGVLVIKITLNPFKPIDNEFFKFDVKKPFDLESGWLVWSIIGFFSACILVNVEAIAESALKGGDPPRDSADALVQLLPIIGASPISTLSLVFIAGVCAPILEETVFRGFLMTSLTKWMPVPWAALFSAFAFSAAHVSPNEFFKLASLGFLLGLSYAKTRNLLTPMVIHGLWNSGVIILLTVLRLNGFDLSELLE